MSVTRLSQLSVGVALISCLISSRPGSEAGRPAEIHACLELSDAMTPAELTFIFTSLDVVGFFVVTFFPRFFHAPLGFPPGCNQTAACCAGFGGVGWWLWVGLGGVGGVGVGLGWGCLVTATATVCSCRIGCRVVRIPLTIEVNPD